MTDDRVLEALAEMEDRFEQRIADLEAQVAGLEDELQEERDRRRRAERALAAVDRDAGTWREDHEMRHEASKNWMDAVEDRVAEVEDELRAVARGEVDASELVAQSQGPAVDDLVPLHQLYLSATNLEPHEHDLSENQEIAARLFPHVATAATPSGDELHLTSPKVRQVIEREIATPQLAKRLDVDDPNPNTVRRVMEFVAKFGKDLFEFYAASGDERRNSTNLVVVDREAWVDYADRLDDAAGGSGAVAADASGRQEARTDGGEITRS